MKKQGFTLIELMVVIVIMGILAAVAVPKLFGMIAKSKASEVGPAAGTYVKLQQAYFSESNKAGGWQLIGYMAPNDGATTNFEYGKSLGIAKDQSSDIASATIGWDAANKVNLNECKAATNWTISIVKATSSTAGDDIKFTASAGNAGCVALTPTFDKIGQ